MSGFIRCIKSKKLLIIANVADGYINNEIYKECPEANKLVLYNVGIDAQYNNINSSNIPNIKEVYFMKGELAKHHSEGLLSFKKLYIPQTMYSKDVFKTPPPAYNKDKMTYEMYNEYMKLIDESNKMLLTKGFKQILIDE